MNLNNQPKSLANLDHRPEKSGRIELDPEGAEEGLAQLVLTIIELLRQLVERQALRRVDGGNLTEEEIEKLGLALMNLDVKMDELKEIFNLTDEDLNIDLGPLGNLL
ncbi:gas vesicle protein K [Oceanobacillus saliphilus]|uniref:gas vesicle protein K n=1 Tax=Oceanobacillus saliphilus TaxID=2925834 RepID=UPI00201D3512